MRRIGSSLLPGLNCRAWIVLSVIVAVGDAGFNFAAAQEAAKGGGKTGENKTTEKSSPEAVMDYSGAANIHNNGAYDLAIEEWTKFISTYPADPLTPKAQYYLAVCHVQLKQFAKATATLQTLLKAKPDFELAEDAYLNLAWSQYSQAISGKPETYQTPQATFETLLQKFPKGKYADEATYFQGECLYNQGKVREAIAAYEAVLAKFDRSSHRCDAAYALGVAQEESGQYAQAEKAYDLFLADCGGKPIATEVRMRKAETMLQQGRVAEAVTIFAEVAGIPDFALADHALMRQADGLVKLDKLAEAATVYERVTATYPNSSRLSTAMLAAGRCLFRLEKLPEAAVWFQRIIDGEKPDTSEAAHWLARIHLRGKRAQDALALVDKVLGQRPDAQWLPQLSFDRADALYELPDKKAEAVSAFLKFAGDSPQHDLAPQALYSAAFGCLELKQYEPAVQHARNFIGKYPQDRLMPHVKSVASEGQLLLNQHAEAEKSYRELVGSFPDQPDVAKWRMRLGLALLLQKKYAEVVAELAPQLAILKAPEMLAEANFLVASGHWGLEKYVEAAASYEASLNAQAQWRQADEALLGLARAQRKLEKIPEALKTIQKLIDGFPGSAVRDQAFYRRGEFAYAAGDFEQARSAYEQVATQWPESSFAPYAIYGQGWSQFKLQRYPKAVEHLTALITKFPQHALLAEALYARGMGRRLAGDFAGAIEDLNGFLKTSPDPEKLSHASFERGLAEVSAKQLPAAIASFRQIIKDHPKYDALDKVRYELAWALKSEGMEEQASQEFAALVAATPKSPLAAESHFHIGEFHYQQREYDQAIKEYAKALPASQSAELTEKAAYKSGWAHYQQKQYEPALDHFKQQLEAAPAGTLATDGRFMSAECLFRLQKFQEAYASFVAARKAPDLPAKLEVLVLLHGGQAAGQLKMWNESQELLAALLQKFADSPYLAEAHYELGRARQNLKQLDEALKNYEFAAAKSREVVGARARFMIGEIMFEKKQFDEAIKQFQRVMYTYGGEQATADIKVWQSQAGFEAARCWEVQIAAAADPGRKAQCTAEAKRHYTYVVEKHPQSSFATEARKRLEALAKL
ncbi:MAG: tetratricopeptide repeat protein [Planctomycetes bacterium]|nr:tetratricopeptide repeat protein [Planctomycetota bacterium]